VEAVPALARLRTQRVPLRFYRRDPVTVGRALLGCALVRGDRAGVIVETEAYLGPEDKASHSRFGPTARTSVMFGAGGVSMSISATACTSSSTSSPATPTSPARS